jgi:hypothetical protein
VHLQVDELCLHRLRDPVLTSTSGGQCDLEFLPTVARRSVADGGDPTRRMLERVMASTLSSTHTVERIHVRHVVVV